MSTWGNTDAVNQKPKFDALRTTREVLQFTVSTGNNTPNTIITVNYSDGGPWNNVSNVGVRAGQWVYFYANGFGNFGGQTGNGVPGFFKSNTTVASTRGNTITLSSGLFNNVAAGFGVEFDNVISYATSKPQTANYNTDTMLITQTRMANIATNLPTGITANQVGNMSVGWVHVQKKTNNDGTVRYLKETLVALANPTASNTASANGSFGSFLAGL